MKPVAEQEAAVGGEAGFSALGIGEPMLSSLSALGYEEPTPIQQAAIPPLLEGRDLLGQAATGTGKTAAFTLPLLERLRRAGTTTAAPKAPRALVLVPTRELAMQVAEAVTRYGQGLGVTVLPIYGGAPMPAQVKALSRGVTVVVATPGRALDHLRRSTLRLDAVETLILDEADEMLDMGFADDLEALLAATPSGRQTALLSATLPPRIQAIAGKHLREPARITIARERVSAGELPRVRQVAYIVVRAYKLVALSRVLELSAPPAAIVFCRTRTEVDEITDALVERGYGVEALHGGLSQAERDRVMKRFRSGACQVLVATDVAARGLDIEHVSHVINFDVPSAPEAYVHRIGRTGRAGREGAAITIAEPREQRLLHNIEQLTRHKIAVEPVPDVAALRAQRLTRLEERVRATLDDKPMTGLDEVVTRLSAGRSAAEVAAAALGVLASSRPAAALADDAISVPGPRPSMPKPSDWKTQRRPPSSEAPPHAHAGPQSAAPARGAKTPRGAREVLSNAARLFIGAGTDAGIRPADLVGAIANEAGLQAKQIGAIRINERFSLVEVPDALADDVVSALRNTKLKGRKVVVRRDRAGE